MPKSRSGARAPEVVERLQRSRARLHRRRARERQRENEIKAAVAEHIDAWQTITALTARRDADLAQIRARIAQVEAAAAEQINQQQARQAAAAAAIKALGETDDGIAELLEITPRQVRQFLTAARLATATTPAADHGRQEGEPDRQAGDGRQSIQDRKNRPETSEDASEERPAEHPKAQKPTDGEDAGQARA